MWTRERERVRVWVCSSIRVRMDRSMMICGMWATLILPRGRRRSGTSAVKPRDTSRIDKGSGLFGPFRFWVEFTGGSQRETNFGAGSWVLSDVAGRDRSVGIRAVIPEFLIVRKADSIYLATSPPSFPNFSLLLYSQLRFSINHFATRFTYFLSMCISGKELPDFSIPSRFMAQFLIPNL